jgi:hypothetical protein
MPRNYTTDEKVADFEDAVRTHILDASEALLNHDPPFGLAAVRLMAAYFELIAKYKDGFTHVGQSKKYFLRGCRDVIERLPPARRRWAQRVEDHQLEAFYELVRCGLYHGAVPSLNVTLGGSMYGLTISENGRQLSIDATSLLGVLRRDFNAYVEKLRDKREQTIRDKFERRWDFEANL